jgi:hypothetical protein
MVGIENPEIETPSSRTALSVGKMVFKSSVDTVPNSSRLPMVAANVRLRDITSKSANFTFSVAVRPRVPLSSQCRP